MYIGGLRRDCSLHFLEPGGCYGVGLWFADPETIADKSEDDWVPETGGEPFVDGGVHNPGWVRFDRVELDLSFDFIFETWCKGNGDCGGFGWVVRSDWSGRSPISNGEAGWRSGSRGWGKLAVKQCHFWTISYEHLPPAPIILRSKEEIAPVVEQALRCQGCAGKRDSPEGFDRIDDELGNVSQDSMAFYLHPSPNKRVSRSSLEPAVPP